MPGMPSTPSAVESGARLGSSLRRPEPSETAYSCQPARASTTSPTAKSLWRDASTRLTVPPSITSPNLDRLGVGARRAHAAAHVGIEREPQRLEQHLAVARLRHRRFGEPEVLRFRRGLGPRGEQDLAVHRHDRSPEISPSDLRLPPKAAYIRSEDRRADLSRYTSIRAFHRSGPLSFPLLSSARRAPRHSPTATRVLNPKACFQSPALRRQEGGTRRKSIDWLDRRSRTPRFPPAASSPNLWSRPKKTPPRWFLLSRAHPADRGSAGSRRPRCARAICWAYRRPMLRER